MRSILRHPFDVLLRAAIGWGCGVGGWTLKIFGCYIGWKCMCYYIFLMLLQIYTKWLDGWKRALWSIAGRFKRIQLFGKVYQSNGSSYIRSLGKVAKPTENILRSRFLIGNFHQLRTNNLKTFPTTKVKHFIAYPK